MDCFGECEGKKAQDPSLARAGAGADGERCVMVEGPLIVGGGPSGLAVAACLKMLNITYTMLERSNCLVPLWQNWTYDRLKLHLPKQFCELPFMPFPRSYPTYPNKDQFLHYIASYSKKFGIHPVFGTTVVSAEHDGQFWVVQTCRKDGLPGVTYRSQWLVVATGENAEPFMPEIEGIRKFHGDVFHTSAYRNGNNYVGKKVLVIGSGNSGMEVALDLANHNARPYMVVRDKVHVMPREMMGLSTFGLSMWLLRWLPIQAVDHILLLLCRLVIGDTASLGITRPAIGPLQLKAINGKTPVLDVGTLDKIRSGDIKVLPAMKHLLEYGAEFIDGRSMDFDAIILATGYRSNVPLWLKEKEFFSEEDGFPEIHLRMVGRGSMGYMLLDLQGRVSSAHL